MIAYQIIRKKIRAGTKGFERSPIGLTCTGKITITSISPYKFVLGYGVDTLLTLPQGNCFDNGFAHLIAVCPK